MGRGRAPITSTRRGRGRRSCDCEGPQTARLERGQTEGKEGQFDRAKKKRKEGVFYFGPCQGPN